MPSKLHKLNEPEALFADHQSQAIAIATVYWRQYRTIADRDELVNVALYGLWEAADSFDPTRGVPFMKWAVRRIKGAILDEVRLLGGVRSGRRTRVQTVPFANGQDATDELLESHAEWDEASVDHALSHMADDAKLTPQERKTVVAHVAGDNPQDTAKALGTSYESVMSSWSSARHKIRKWEHRPLVRPLSARPILISKKDNTPWEYVSPVYETMDEYQKR